MDTSDSNLFQLVADVEALLESLEAKNDDSSSDSLGTIQIDNLKTEFDTVTNIPIDNSNIWCPNEMSRLATTFAPNITSPFFSFANRWEESGTSTVAHLSNASVDATHVQPTSKRLRKKSNRSDSNTLLFPQILYNMLDTTEEDGYGDCISWQSHGRAFLIHDEEQFARIILPKYFHSIKFSSFQRQLALYGFKRIRHNRDRGAYYHTKFVRGLPHLCQMIVRRPIKGTKNYIGHVIVEPDFYNMTNDGTTSPNEQQQQQPQYNQAFTEEKESEI